MTTADILVILKINLGICTDATTQQGAALESLLAQYVTLSVEAIKREGATLPENGQYTEEDGMLIMLYADHLYRRRADAIKAITTTQQSMPRQLRYLLNNRILSEKAKND